MEKESRIVILEIGISKITDSLVEVEGG